MVYCRRYCVSFFVVHVVWNGSFSYKIKLEFVVDQPFVSDRGVPWFCKFQKVGFQTVDHPAHFVDRVLDADTTGVEPGISAYYPDPDTQMHPVRISGISG